MSDDDDDDAEIFEGLPKVGDTITVPTPEGGETTVRVTRVYRRGQDIVINTAELTH